VPDRRGLPFGTVLLALVFVGGVIPIAFAWHFGALGIPRNDDGPSHPRRFNSPTRRR